MKKRFLTVCAALSVVVALALTGCSKKDGFAMGTYLSLDFSGGKSVAACSYAQKVLKEIEADFSINIESSYISSINAAAAGESVTVSEEVFSLLERAVALYEQTDGAFNPFIYPLVKVWGFTESFKGEGSVPAEADIERAKALCSSEFFLLDVEALTVTKTADGAGVDLGGIAKGYATDKIKEKSLEYGVKRAIINLGGNLQLLGKDFKIGVTAPRGDGSLYGVVKLSDCAAATSGDYERYFTVGGKRYHHVLDAGTGYPADNGENSVYGASVFSSDSATADAVATAFVVSGWDGCEILFEKIGAEYGLSAVIIGAKGYKILGGAEFDKL